MINRFELEGVTWVDLESPTSEEIAELNAEYSLGPLLVEELMRPTLKPHVDLYPDFAYAVLHFPSIRHTRGVTVAQEIDIIVGKKFIITIHYEPVTALMDFARSFEATTLMKRVSGKLHSGHILFEIVERLYEGVDNELESVEDNVTAIENAIFSGDENRLVTRISEVSRELLIHKRTLGTHRETLDSLEKAGTNIFGDTFQNYLRGMTALHFRVYNKALSLIDTVAELRNTNDSLLTTRQNEIMKNLTIVASIMLPLTLLTQLFSMNTENTPLVGNKADFWIVVLIMGVITIGLFAFFKLRRWL